MEKIVSKIQFKLDTLIAHYYLNQFANKIKIQNFLTIFPGSIKQK